MPKISAEEAIKPISWLIGKWKSLKAHGSYPGVEPFDYKEEIEFQYFGQYLLGFDSKTYLHDKPKHYERGFLKISENKLCFMLAHNFGLTSMEEGKVNGCEIKLKSSEISRMSFAIEPAVCQINRSYTLCDNRLNMVLYMATNEKPLTKHLAVVYEKSFSC